MVTARVCGAATPSPSTLVGCDTGSCAHEWQLCMDACGFCSAVIFDFEYADTRELTPLGPPPSSALLYEDEVLVENGARE